MADVADIAHEEASVSRVQCRSCGYTLGSVPRCPECAHTEQVYLFPDTISKAWIVALVLAVMLGSRPILRVPFMIILEGSVGAWLDTQFSFPGEVHRLPASGGVAILRPLGRVRPAKLHGDGAAATVDRRPHPRRHHARERRPRPDLHPLTTTSDDGAQPARTPPRIPHVPSRTSHVASDTARIDAPRPTKRVTVCRFVRRCELGRPVRKTPPPARAIGTSSWSAR